MKILLLYFQVYVFLYIQNKIKYLNFISMQILKLYILYIKKLIYSTMSFNDN